MVEYNNVADLNPEDHFQKKISGLSHNPLLQ